jgi:hypothetical protein
MRLRYALMFFAFMGAMACALFGVQEYNLAAQSSREPEEISLRDLIRRGAEGNPNIILTNFNIFEDYIYQRKLVSGKWTKVWVPIVPVDENADGTGTSPAIHAFLYSEDIGSDKEVRQRFGAAKLRGMVNPSAEKPGIVGRVLLNKLYPGTNPSKCIIIEENRTPAGTLKLGLYSIGFVLLAGLTGGIWYLARLLDKVELEPKPSASNLSDDGKAQDRSGPIIEEVLPADDQDE